MSHSDILHKALYYAMLDLRSRGSETDDKLVFGLADLFHNVVLQMGQAAQGNGQYSDALAYLKETADETGCEIG
jgi:hypothetical protein